jgi:hypothetical protein
MTYARAMLLLLFTSALNPANALQASPKRYSLLIRLNSNTEEYEFEQKNGKNLKYSNHLNIEYREINSEGLKKIIGIFDELCRFQKSNKISCDDRLEFSCGEKTNTQCMTKENFEKFKKIIVNFKEVTDNQSSMKK